MIVDYSTSEQDTGMKWIDGKAIFQITILVAALPNGTVFPDVTTAHGITFERMIDFQGAAQDSPITEFVPQPRSGTSAPVPGAGVEDQTFNLDAFIDPTDLTSSTDADYSAYSSYVTIWYTKP